MAARRWNSSRSSGCFDPRPTFGTHRMSTLAPPSPGVQGRWARVWSQRRGWPLVTVFGAVIAAALVLLPLVFLVVEAQRSGWSTTERLLFRHLTAVLLWNTVRLVVVSTTLCAAIG